MMENNEAFDGVIINIIRVLSFLCFYSKVQRLYKSKALDSKNIALITGFSAISFLVFRSLKQYLPTEALEMRELPLYFISLLDFLKVIKISKILFMSLQLFDFSFKSFVIKCLEGFGTTFSLTNGIQLFVFTSGIATGVKRLEAICWFAIMALIINYVACIILSPLFVLIILKFWHKDGPLRKITIVQRIETSAINFLHRTKSIDHAQLMRLALAYAILWMPFVLSIILCWRWIFFFGDNFIVVLLATLLSLRLIFYDEHFTLRNKIKSCLECPEKSDLTESNTQLSSTNQYKVLGLSEVNRKGSGGSPVMDESKRNDGKTQFMFQIDYDSDSENDSENSSSGECNPKLMKDLSQLWISNTDNDELVASRSLEEVKEIYEKSEFSCKSLTTGEVILLLEAKVIPAYQLEKAVEDVQRGIHIRRCFVNRSLTEERHISQSIPFKNFDYSYVLEACCENVIGYIPIPLGVAGPLKIDEETYQIPMATTEGCLVASTNRGCRALVNGVQTRVITNGMSRAPVLKFPTASQACEAMLWINDAENFDMIRKSFDSSSRFARLQKIQCKVAGRYLFLRMVATTGDAMGMNMISKGAEIALRTLQTFFPDMDILSLSGNLCTDKKPAAINWIEGRGKGVVSESVIPGHIIKTVLKTTVESLVEINIAKNLVGSATAGSIGGFNAHAANIVTAIYIACGQDPAQNIGSSNCMTLLEPWGKDGQDLFISCTMPSIEVGTIGGGTILGAQSSCLSMLGVKGSHKLKVGKNAETLASVVCSAVLAGELSLISALSAGHLVRSHLKHNRSSVNLASSIPTCAIDSGGLLAKPTSPQTSG